MRRVFGRTPADLPPRTVLGSLHLSLLLCSQRGDCPRIQAQRYFHRVIRRVINHHKKAQQGGGNAKLSGCGNSTCHLQAGCNGRSTWRQSTNIKTYNIIEDSKSKQHQQIPPCVFLPRRRLLSTGKSMNSSILFAVAAVYHFCCQNNTCVLATTQCHLLATDWEVTDTDQHLASESLCPRAAAADQKCDSSLPRICSQSRDTDIFCTCRTDGRVMIRT